MASIFVFWQMAKLLWMEMVFEESVVWALTIVVSLFCFTRGMGCLKALASSSLHDCGKSRTEHLTHSGNSTAEGGGYIAALPSNLRGRKKSKNEAERKAIIASQESSFSRSQAPNIRHFLKWHTLWHFTLPLGSALWLEIRSRRLRSVFC